MSGFLSERGQHVEAFRRLLAETVAVTTVAAIIVSLLVIPVAWDLPRAGITAVIVIGAAVFAAIGASLLKPLYWRQARVFAPGLSCTEVCRQSGSGPSPPFGNRSDLRLGRRDLLAA